MKDSHANSDDRPLVHSNDGSCFDDTPSAGADLASQEEYQRCTLAAGARLEAGAKVDTKIKRRGQQDK